MKKKNVLKVMSAALSAVLLMTSVPVSALAASSLLAVPTAQKAVQDENLLKLWYDEPVSKGSTILDAGGFGTTAEDNKWQQLTLPIGNSFMGANIYGEIASERLTFNQKTLWNGGPSESRKNYNGGNKSTASNGKKMSEAYEDVVNAFLSGNDSTASTLCNQLVGESSGYGAYQSWGDIYLTFSGLTDSTAASSYERNLDLTTAIANVDFTAGGTAYHREYFISYPDNVLAMKLTADGDDSMSLNVSFPVDNAEGVTSRNLGKNVNYQVDAQEKSIVTSGSLQDNQMKLNSKLQVVTSGQVTAGLDNMSLNITDAQEVIIFVSADTDYKNDYPSYRTGETEEQLAKSVASVVDAAAEKGYDAVKASHLADYQELFSRVDLDLGQDVTGMTTDALLAAYKNNTATDAEKRLLEVLLYQYGRYLTIASSREGDLPSNLQGVWQNRVGDANRVPWGSDYHMNVNLQMNYWPTYSSNLAECATPLIDYVDSLREPGRVTAETYFGISSAEGEANGFTAHTQNTPFGWTCPGWDFSWGWSPAAVPWILQNCWEYYEYTKDEKYMEEKIYPMMKEEAILYDQILVDSGVEITLEDGTKSSRLVSAPTYSPEHGPRTLGNAYEQELIWQLYEDCITAAETLGVDEDLVKTWKENQSRLAPIEVGDSGQIKEWYNETTLGSIGDRGHRHMSHLLGLFPGDLISVDNDTYMDAAIVSLTDRGMESTGWGMGQRINSWARTGKGDKAYQLIQTLFKKGIYPNMWDTHSPFQIDGNFGYTSGVNEMLMQSNMGYINILPAIPDEWSDGSVDGIVARGNFEIGIEWKDGEAVSIEILSQNGGECQVQYKGITTAVVTDSSGKQIAATPVEGEKNRVSFLTEKGETYTVSNLPKTPSAPKNVKAKYYGESGVKVSWQEVEDADSYIVYRAVNGSFTKIAEGVARTSYIDPGSLTEPSSVQYKVVACVGSLEGKESAVASVEDLTSTELSKNGWKAVAGSEEASGNDGPAEWAIDGDVNTLWHTKWSGGGVHPDIANNLNNEFTIDFGQNVTLNKLEYVPRGGSSNNGVITGYTLWYSTTASGDDFVKITEGNWASDKTVKSVEFEPTEMRRIQIRATATMDDTGTKNQHVTAAEFNVYKVSADVAVMVDNEELWNLVLEIKEKDLSGYTEETAKALENAQAEAKKILVLEDDADQKDIDDALERLKKAYEGLEAKKPDTDKSSLTAAIADAEKTVLTGYASESVQIFQKALEDARRVCENPDATQEEIQKALDAVKAAKAGLVKAVTPPPTVTVPAVGKTVNVGGVTYKVTKSASVNGTAAAVKLADKKKTKITIPATVKIDGFTFKVTSVSAKVFRKNKKIKSVVIGSNVTDIGKESFYKCEKLASVTFKGTGVPKFGKNAFRGTASKIKVTVSKKMTKKNLTKVKAALKKAGISKKVVYKKK